MGAKWPNQRPTRKATYRLKAADAIEGQSEGTGARRNTAEGGKSRRETNKKRKATEHRQQKNTNDHKKRVTREARERLCIRESYVASPSALHQPVIDGLLIKKVNEKNIHNPRSGLLYSFLPIKAKGKLAEAYLKAVYTKIRPGYVDFRAENENREIPLSWPLKIIRLKQKKTFF